MSEPVAVGVDGSDESVAATAWAAREALARGVPLLMVCATGDRRPGPGPGAAADAQREQAADDILARGRRQIAAAHPELPVTARNVPVAPVQALLEAAETSVLLVLGSRGMGALAGFVVGSVSLSVIAHSSRPVVAVRSTATPGDTVVVGLDFQQDCEPLLGLGFGMASRRRWKLRTVHSWSVSRMFGFPSALPDSRSVREAEAEAGRRSRALLAPWREQYPDVDTEVSTGSVAVLPHLLQMSADAGLLVAGRRTPARSFPTRLGPVTHGLLHHAACAVAVVPLD